MTRSTTLIPVSPIKFIGETPSVHTIENRLQMFLRTLRALKQDNNLEAVKLILGRPPDHVATAPLETERNTACASGSSRLAG